MGFCDGFAIHLQLRTRDVCAQFKQYLCGLMQARKKNMERMAEVVPQSDDQVLQHFLSNSTRNERGVFDQVAREADATSQPASAWKRLTLRDSTKGELQVVHESEGSLP